MLTTNRRLIRNLLRGLSIACLLGIAVVVQGQADVSGTWEFESSTALIFNPNSPMFDYSSRLVIAQSGSDIVISTMSHLELHNKKTGAHETVFDENDAITFHSDGRGEINTLPDGSKFFTKTEWKGGKLRTTYFSGPPDEKKSEVVGLGEIELSKDGQRLSVVKKEQGVNGQGNTAFATGQGSELVKNLMAHASSEINNRTDKYKRATK